MYLAKTIESIVGNARGEIEVIANLDGYWPDPPLKNYENLHIIRKDKPKGMRAGINSCVDIARGEFLLKCDAHCAFAEGFDVTLAESCEEDWVVVPRRRRLDAENWKVIEDGRPDIDYVYLSYPVDITDPKTPGFHGKEWSEKNRDESLRSELIVDLMSAQGSCWFMRRDYFHELELEDEEHYGTFANEFQEIGLKCWLSGGRVVRNKGTWYAHLHKSSRGYNLSKATVAQANGWTKRWATNDAWDRGRVKRDLKWLVERFAPVPGWEEHDWNEWGQWDNTQIISTVAEVKPQRKVRTYQNIELEGVVPQNPRRKESKFWNEGKWENFVVPLLPQNGRVFVEIGSDAGLFLRLAREKYERVVGVDKSRTMCKVARRYRDELGLDYEILHRTVGVDFDYDELPVADVTLLATVHYYFDVGDWLELLDKMRWKTRYCIVVSRSVDPDAHWKPSGEIADIRNYFRDWTEVRAIGDVDKRGDPAPRDLWSLAFQSDLVRMPIDDVYIKNERHRSWVKDYEEMDGAKRELAEEIAKNDEIDVESTSYFAQWMQRKSRHWSEEKIREFVQEKVDIMYDVKRNGLKSPILVKMTGQICDGGHRLAVLRAMGEESVIVRIV